MHTYTFRKSSYSDHLEECVEVAIGPADAVVIRDSKRTEGPTLHVTPAAWASFLTTLHLEPCSMSVPKAGFYAPSTPGMT
ncbi:DUF397 domain-containing protein [Streptomyces rimosus]|uniref:DUF397 domain-containing protein n=1 Tax=Streptomyces rimosus TaxID=1927 RepID=UPI0005190F64|nr:DUF397 domain-containing protein [Streptomyces rimosus]